MYLGFDVEVDLTRFDQSGGVLDEVGFESYGYQYVSTR